jgi:NAD(P)-dependent dehydrogenase (short-subunit alcohol dehydrogenase family)
LRQAGRIDVLVNNAGFGLFGAIEETSLDEARGQLETNFWGAVRLTQGVLPHMRQRRSGRIINITSVLGFMPVPFHAFYVASKHALEGYSEVLALEVRPFGVYVTVVEPSFIRSAFFEHRQEAKAPLDAYKRERDLVSPEIRRISHWRSPVALPYRGFFVQQLRQCEAALALNEKLPAVLRGDAPPANTAETLTLAQLCQQHKQMHVAAARFYADAFQAGELGSFRFARDAKGAVTGFSIFAGRVLDVRFNRLR